MMHLPLNLPRVTCGAAAPLYTERPTSVPCGRCATILDLRLACTHACRMSKMVQIRNVPTRRPRALIGRVALVAGATRGAGRGVARALGEAGATVYCTGRSVK